MIIGPDPRTKQAKMLVILLHGYGSCGANMAHLAHALALREVSFWCPDGPQICQEYPSGRQWFSLKGIDWEKSDLAKAWQIIQKPLSDAAQSFYANIKAQVDGFSGPVILAGFSQGAMMAYELGLFGPVVNAIIGLAGVYCLTQMPPNTPELFWIHAQDDAVVPFQWMHQAHQLFQQNGFHPEHHISQQGGHSVPQDGLLATAQFLQKILRQHALTQPVQGRTLPH